MRRQPWRVAATKESMEALGRSLAFYSIAGLATQLIGKLGIEQVQSNCITLTCTFFCLQEVKIQGQNLQQKIT